MKSNIVLISSIVLLAAVLASTSLVSVSAATDIVDGSMAVTFNDVILSGSTLVAAQNGEVVPIRVAFKAMDDAKDLRIKVWLEGYRTDVSAQTSRMNVLKGAIYTSVLNLEMPSDLNDVAKSYILHLSISNADGYEEAQYSLQLQRKAYDMNILSVDYNSDAQAGEVVPFLVVVENGGMEKIRNGYVTVSIPALGVSTRGYFGHLVATESDDSDQVDAVQKIVYLKVPESTKDGLYEVVIQAYNEETTTTVKKAIQIGESSSAASPSLIVTGKTSSNNSNNSAYVVALTVVLAIIFVVLFIVLIVLLTRKERPVEEETSYY